MAVTIPRLRVKSIAPIALPEDQLAWRAQRYRDLAQAAGDIEIELVNLRGTGAPPSLDTDDQVLASIDLVRAEVMRTDPRQFDVVLPDCVLDPGVFPDEPSPVPVVGILRLVGFQLAAHGRTFSAVTRNEPIARELQRRVTEYGLDNWFAGVDVIDGGIDLVSNETEWMNRLRGVAAGQRAQAAGTIFNGCSAVNVEHSYMQGVVVIDPAPMALQLLHISASGGLFPGHLAPPVLPTSRRQPGPIVSPYFSGKSRRESARHTVLAS